MLALVEDRTRERRVEAVRRDFVANVSHELKTPVGAIKLLAEAVSDASEDPEAVKRFAGRMLTESDRLTRLVQQIIELSRLQADDPLETPTAVSIDDVIGIAVDTSAIDADSKRIDIVTGGTPGLEVFGNEEQVTAAVANLVANAVSYSAVDSTVLRHHQGRRRGRSRSRSSTRASASRRTRSTGSSSGSTGSTRPGTAPREAPGSASRSSSTSPPPTAATSGCGPSRARVRRSR